MRTLLPRSPWKRGVSPSHMRECGSEGNVLPRKQTGRPLVWKSLPQVSTPLKGRRVIYLDNAATSYPKPPQVAEAMLRFIREIGANPGRSAHRLSVEASRIVYEAWEALARLLNIADPLRIAFGLNATEALNLALYGILRPGDHVVTSSMEHNSVMRPLRALERRGVEVTVVPCSPEGFLDPADIEAAIKPNTKLIVLNHASNVVGTLLPIAEAGEIARRHGLLLLVDAAQTAGAYPIDVEADRIDLLAFTGHKSLYGPMGTGGLYIGERVPFRSLSLSNGAALAAARSWRSSPTSSPICARAGPLTR